MFKKISLSRNKKKEVIEENKRKREDEQRKLKEMAELEKRETLELEHLQRYIEVLAQPFIDKKQLTTLTKNGISKQIRGKVWKILTGYIPCDNSRQDEVIENKRNEYKQLIKRLINCGLSINEEKHETQIQKDLTRLTRDIPFVFHEKIQQLMKRLLLIYAIRHPASGYVQGMSDMIVPFLVVYIDEYSFNSYDMNVIDLFNDEELSNIEADVYWSFCWILQSIQSHYTYQQPGIHSQLKQLEYLTQKYNNKLDKHFKSINMEYVQFAFRWFNCCLIREFPTELSLILWDGYLSEPNGIGFQYINLYCCFSLLDSFTDQIVSKDFVETLTFLQHLPTKEWNKDNIQSLLLIAYSYYTMESFH